MIPVMAHLDTPSSVTAADGALLRGMMLIFNQPLPSSAKDC